MRTFQHAVALIAAAAVLASCTDTAPTPTDAFVGVASADGVPPVDHPGGAVRTIELLDRCDPLTFNAAVGEGTCKAGRHGITFQEFLAQLQRLHNVPMWRFSPPAIDINLGDSFLAKNVGGETHTFTEVEEFGGGIVPLLNTAAGLTDVAPECNALVPADFLAPGATHSDTPDEAGTEKYQCCIHPWMRATVRIAQGSGTQRTDGGRR